MEGIWTKTVALRWKEIGQEQYFYFWMEVKEETLQGTILEQNFPWDKVADQTQREDIMRMSHNTDSDAIPRPFPTQLPRM